MQRELTKEARRLQADRASGLLVGCVASILAGLFATQVLAAASWDPTVFAGFGEQATEIREYAESRLGEVSLRPQLGHDGRFFFVQANDPWLTNPPGNASILDRPVYRNQRMLFPMLAGGFGWFQPEVIVWAMLLVNLAAMGLGSWAVAVIATEMGGSRWWGLAFLLNIGMSSELSVGGAGIVAGAAAFGAVAMLMRDQTSWAVLLMTLAALSREVMLVAAAGAAWLLWREDRRRDAVWLVTVPVSAAVVWRIYATSRIGSDAAGSQILEIGLPFVGYARAFRGWLSDPIDLIVGCTLMILLLAFLARTLRSRSLVGWSFVGFVPLAMLLTEPVWRQYFDATRALAPPITAFVLIAFVRRRGTSAVSTVRGTAT